MFLENISRNLPAVPEFRTFFLNDRNPLGKTGKKRKITAPNEAMKILHRRFLKFLRQQPGLNRLLASATGCRHGNSPRRNVMLHRRHRYFYLLDLRNAYPSVNGEKLAAVLCSLMPRLSAAEQQDLFREQAVLKFLKNFCLAATDGLLIGAPASPDLFNIYAASLIDQPLRKFA